MIDIVTAVRDKYPTPLGARHGEFLVEVAKATKKGLLRKEVGSFIEVPGYGKVAQDILTDPQGLMHYDILVDAEGYAVPSWNEKGTYDPTRYVAVTGAEDPNDQPDAPPEEESRLDKIIRLLENLSRHLGAPNVG